MQKLILYITLLLLAAPVAAQQKQVQAWRVTNNLGTTQTAAIDTLKTNFQDATPDLQNGILSDFSGNLGSPLQSKEFFRRENNTHFLFAYPYEAYLHTADNILFYDTRTPYSNVSYFTGGPTNRGEDRLNALFTVNINPKLNFGFMTDYIYGRGVYLNQSTNHFLATIFGSYRSEHYTAQLSASVNNLQNRENGGIVDTGFITNPQETGNLKPEQIEVNLNNRATSKLRSMDLRLNHRYSLGIEREKAVNDTLKIKEFIPVTTFAHTIRFENFRKTYWEETAGSIFYEQFPAYNHFFNSDKKTLDRAYQEAITNVFSVSLNEEFNRFARFGLTAFVENKHQPYRFEEGRLNEKSENNTALGGILSKYLGRKFLYDATGKMTVAGKRAGDFELWANIWSNIQIAGDSVVFSASGFVKNLSPDFFWENYESNHVKWSNSFDRQFRTRLQGKLDFPSWEFHARAQVENVKNHLYFNSDALPAQEMDNIQIIALSATKNFHLGNFHFEHDAVYQLTSNKDVIPLPTWLLRANWYYTNVLFKVLTAQLGAEVRYFSEYYAPNYMPAIGQFFVQSGQKVGNYPFVNIYGNFHLKTVRFFVNYTHANFDISEPNYFLIPNYPVNPSMVRLGVSWNFYN
ncbi:MAG: putative porin [Prevotellaceae bacterium]|jgi:hypothetical protein|nr:putative porin [Prevotellaceae bacterium]